MDTDRHTRTRLFDLQWQHEGGQYRYELDQHEPKSSGSLTQAWCMTASHDDFTECQRVRDLLEACRRAIPRAHGVLIIDLTDVRKADTKLVAAIVLIYRLATAQAVRIRLYVSKEVASLLHVCKLQSLIGDAAES